MYATNATILPSDERLKDFFDIDEAEKSAALEIKSTIRKFQWKAKVATEGEDARYHSGVGAQTVKAIMESHGLVPEKYSFFCYDEWADETEEIPAEVVNHPLEVSDDGVITDAYIEELSPAHTVVNQVAGNRYSIRYTELIMFILAAT